MNRAERYRWWIQAAAASRREKARGLAELRETVRNDQLLMLCQLIEIWGLPETSDCPALELLPKEAA